MHPRAVILIGLLFVVAAVWGLAIVSKQYERVAAGVAPLSSFEADGLRYAVVGSGGTYENQDRSGPAVALASGTDVVLVDAGRGVAEALRRAQIPPGQPSVVLLTSLLAENVTGLDDLLVARALVPGAPPGPLSVVGPPGTRDLVERLVAAHGPGVTPQAERLGLPALTTPEVVEVGPEGFSGTAGALNLRALPVGETGSLVVRIGDASREIAVSSLGDDPDALVEAALGADTWIHAALVGAALDAALDAEAPTPGLTEEATLHTRLEDVGALASRIGARTLVLTRLRPPPVYHFQFEGIVREQFRGRVVIAEDAEWLP